MNYEQHNNAINGWYWNDIVWQRVGEFFGSEGEFGGLEKHIQRLSDSRNLKGWFWKAKTDDCLLVGPQLVNEGPEMGPFLRLNMFRTYEGSPAYFDYWVNFENPPVEIHQALRQKTHEDGRYPVRALFNLDVEHRFETNPAKIINQQQECFESMEPHRHAVQEVLGHFDFKYFTIQTGKGFQVAAQLKHDPDLYERIISIAGKLESGVAARLMSHDVTPKTELIHKGLRRLELYVQHLALQQLVGRRDILPAMIFYTTDSEQIDFDIMANTKFCRAKAFAAFGIPYLKFQSEQHHKGYADSVRGAKIPFRLLKGVNGADMLDVSQAIRVRNDIGLHLEYMQEAEYHLPECSEGLSKLLDSYERSDFKRKVFDKIDEAQFDPEWKWHSSYRNYDGILNQHPHLGYFLEQPNHFLFRNDASLDVMNTLLHSGWHPKHIAGFLTAVCSDPRFNFGRKWIKEDPERYCTGLVEIFLTDKYIKGELPW